MFNAAFKNISVILRVSFFGGRN